MSIQTNFPSINPSLLLDFSNTRQLDTRVTFTRSTTATYFDALGLLKTASANVPRFDYNPTTGESLGLLIEEQRTNLLTYSSEFDNAAWTKTNANVTVSANTTTSPSGASDADTLNSLSAASDNRVVQTATVANDSAVYTASVFVKKIATSYTRVDLRFINGTTQLNYAYAINLDSQTIFSSGGNIASSVGLTSVGNGWYRVSISAPNNSTGNTSAGISCYPSVDSAGATTTIGSVYIYGAQLEAGAFPTSYIPTTTAAATRNADAASMTGTNFSSWYNATEGTMVAEFNISFALPSGSGPRMFTLQGAGGTSVDEMPLFVSQISGKAASFNAFTGGVNAVRIDASPAFSANTVIKAAAAYAANNRAVTTGGAAPTTSTNAYTIPTITLARLGSDNASGSGALNGYLRRIAYYPRRLINSQLQALTS